MFENANRQESLLEVGAYAVVGGAVVGALFPEAVMYAHAITFTGLAGIGYYISTWSKFDKLWKNLSLGKGQSHPICKGKEKTEISTIYRFTLPAGASLEDFKRNKQAIEQFLGQEVSITYTYKEIQIETFERGDKKQEYPFTIIPCKGAIEFPIGYDYHGKQYYCDLSAGGDNCHMLIAGTSGGGKSVFLKGVITSLVVANKVDIHLVDLKGCEFNVFEDCSRVKSISTSIYDTEHTLNTILGEMQRRYDVFRQAKCEDIRAYNKKHKKEPLPYIAIIIDEFAELMNESGCQRTLERLSALSRAAGISLILATQRPDAKVISSRIKCNCNVVLGLKTSTDINSRVIIGDDKLTKLRGHGHGIFRYGGNDVEIQTMNITSEQAAELVKPYEGEKPSNIIQLPIDRKEEEITNFDFLEKL